MASSAPMSQSPYSDTDDATYNLTSVLYHALQGVDNCAIYAEDADDETRGFFERACDQQREIAQEAKRLLHDCLMRDLQGGSAQATGNAATPSRDEPGTGGAQNGGLSTATNMPDAMTKAPVSGGLAPAGA